MKIKLAEALLRRKELQQQVDRIRPLNVETLFETQTGRKAAHEGLDDIIVKVSKIAFQQVTHAFDTHARALREIDAAIQQANWTTEIEVSNSSMEDYVDPYVEVAKAK